MFYVYSILALTILLYEYYNLWKQIKKDWPAILTVLFITIGAIAYTAIYNFDLIALPPTTKGLNTLLKSLLPSFYDFMRV